MTDLGTLNGAYANSFPNSENTAGQIVGNSDTAVAGQEHPFVTNPAGLTDLGTLGGKSASAFGINSAGMIVGASLLSDNSTLHAFEYQNGTMVDLGTLGGKSSQAFAINDAGEIVGNSTTAGGQNRAFTLVNGQVTLIPTLGGAISQANAANATGALVGFSQNASGDNHAFIYQSGTVTDLNNTLGGKSSTAVAINATGQIAGTYQPSGADSSHQHAFLYDNGAVTDLGTLGGASSQATAIDSQGDVIGSSFVDSNTFHAFLYSNGVMKDIDTVDGNTTAIAVNNNDQVLINLPNFAGVRYYSNGSVVNPVPSYATYSDGVAMNSHGDVVGNLQVGNSSHAFLYSNGLFTDLETLFDPSASTYATDINDDGEILGRVSLPNNTQYVFLDSNGTIYDLNNYVTGLPPNWTLSGATFYPGTSDLLATAFYGSRTTTFLLSVPEPGAVFLTLIAPLFLLRRRRDSCQSAVGR